MAGCDFSSSAYSQGCWDTGSEVSCYALLPPNSKVWDNPQTRHLPSNTQYDILPKDAAGSMLLISIFILTSHNNLLRFMRRADGSRRVTNAGLQPGSSDAFSYVTFSRHIVGAERQAQTILLQKDSGLPSGLALASVRRSERPLLLVPWGKNGYFLACSVREDLSLSSIF